MRVCTAASVSKTCLWWHDYCGCRSFLCRGPATDHSRAGQRRPWLSSCVNVPACFDIFCWGSLLRLCAFTCSCYPSSTWILRRRRSHTPSVCVCVCVSLCRHCARFGKQTNRQPHLYNCWDCWNPNHFCWRVVVSSWLAEPIIQKMFNVWLKQLSKTHF